MSETMRWSDDPTASRSSWALVVNFVNARGGFAEFQPRRPGWVGDEPSILVMTSIGPAYCAPGQRVVMGDEWFWARVDGFSQERRVREFTVQDAPIPVSSSSTREANNHDS